MKKITKVILAAALVLLVAGAFTGAAAAVGSAPIGLLPAETHAQAVSLQAAEIHGALGAEAANAPISAVIVKIEEIKGKSVPVYPLTPSGHPGHTLPVHPLTPSGHPSYILPVHIATAESSISLR